MDPEVRNRAAYTDPAIVTHYVNQTDLYAAEVELLADCPPLHELDVLDIGIGGGRTTRAIAPKARRYVGIDYIPQMVSAARQATHGQWDLRIGDATDLSAFCDGEFDLVIFSFNGLGTLPDTQSRVRCLEEVRRVLRPTGLFLFSLGNPAFLKVPAEHPAGLLLRTRSALGYSRHLRRFLEPAFWRRNGWRTDVVLEKALHSYGAHPKWVRRELASTGLHVSRHINGLYPRELPAFQTPWWYYLASRV